MQQNEGEEELKFKTSLGEFLKARDLADRETPKFN